VVMVTHNEMFLHAIAKRLVVFQNGGIDVFEGGYQDFLNKVGWQEEDAPGQAQASNGDKSRPTKKEIKRLRSEFVNERAKILTPLKKKMEETEKHIEKQEELLAAFSEEMQPASEAGDSTKIETLGRSMFQCQSMIDGLFDELEHLTETFESETERFNMRQAKLEAQWK